MALNTEKTPSTDDLESQMKSWIWKQTSGIFYVIEYGGFCFGEGIGNGKQTTDFRHPKSLGKHPQGRRLKG